jgi:hypothetical protein
LSAEKRDVNNLKLFTPIQREKNHRLVDYRCDYGSKTIRDGAGQYFKRINHLEKITYLNFFNACHSEPVKPIS